MKVTCHPRLGGACLWQAGVTGIKSTDFYYRLNLIIIFKSTPTDILIIKRDINMIQTKKGDRKATLIYYESRY